MRHIALSLISFALCVVPARTSRTQGNPVSRAPGGDFKPVDEYVTQRMRSARLPGVAVVIVKGDQIVYAKGFGRADPSGRPVTPRTPFIIGSVTKSFTALAAVQLVEGGKVELDAPVQRYLPWFRVADTRASTRITVRQLLYQTSGMPQPPTSRAAPDTDDGALERAVRSLATLELVGAPGQSFTYSNGNYDTLGMIIQVVSGESYEEYVRQHIFAPLDMRNSYVSQDDAIRGGMASGYRWWFGIPVAATLPYDRSNLPSGYIISSAEDMAHFLVAQMNGGRYGGASVLSPAGIATTHVMPATPYGIGWESVEINGRTLIDHDGGTPNFEASLFFDPQERVGVFIAANASGVLDAFTSPPGPDFRDGPSVRAMALSILSLATSRPLPDQGIGHARLYLIYDVVLFAFTAAVIVSLARTRIRHRRVGQLSVADSSGVVWRGVRTAILHFALPVVILILALALPTWRVLVSLYQPDFGYWLAAVALVLTIKGAFELAFMHRIFNCSRSRGSV